jgi:hypothetical protein
MAHSDRDDGGFDRGKRLDLVGPPMTSCQADSWEVRFAACSHAIRSLSLRHEVACGGAGRAMA